MSKQNNPPFDVCWDRKTHFHKDDAISCLHTSQKNFDDLGITPDVILGRSVKVFLYTRQQVKEAARLLEQWPIYLGLGGDPSLITNKLPNKEGKI